MNTDAAIDYLYRHGRPLDQRIYEYEFGDGALDAVLDALGEYQNDDGGFGHALEPDLRTPVSSAIATSTGFGILRAVDAPGGHPVVQRAVRYLVDTFEPDRQRWPIIPPEAEQSPRAFWWEYAGIEASFGEFMHNPRAAILGHLWCHAELVPTDMLGALTEVQLAALETPGYEPDMFDLDCYVGFAAAPVPSKVRERLIARLEPAVARLVSYDPDAPLTEMSLVPLRIAPSPDSAMAHLFDRATLDANLDRVAAEQLDDGSWDLGWDWSAIDADAWQAAEREWKGHHIVHKLAMLRAWGRIASGP